MSKHISLSKRTINSEPAVALTDLEMNLCSAQHVLIPFKNGTFSETQDVLTLVSPQNILVSIQKLITALPSLREQAVLISSARA